MTNLLAQAATMISRYRLKLTFFLPLIIALLTATSSHNLSAHNKVVVVPLGDESIDMQCQDGGINQYADCLGCATTEAAQCCEAENTACTQDTDCLALNICIALCSTPTCVDDCKSIRSASTIALHDAINLCISGSGEPNLDGACGLVCPPLPQAP